MSDDKHIVFVRDDEEIRKRLLESIPIVKQRIAESEAAKKVTWEMLQKEVNF